MASQSKPRKACFGLLKKIVLSILRFVLGLAVLLAALWGIFTLIADHQSFVESYYQVQSDKLTSNVRVVQLSDLHLREFGDHNSELIERITALKPDIIAITGDMNDKLVDDYSVVTDLCTELVKIAPVYYVPGNHEWPKIVFDHSPIREDLEAVGRMLQAPDAYKPLFLTGFYGMGKSTLAVRFAQEWKQNYPDAQVFWVRFPQQGGLPVLLGETMAQAISTVQTRDSAGCRLPQKTLCDDVLEQLGQNLRRDDLIVIDNADSETLTLTELLYGTEDERDAAQWKEDLYPRLCSLPAHILMTTRMAVQKEKSFYHYPVKPLSLSALRAMMRSYYPAPCSDKVLNDLITLVESHTMTVGMIARTMQDSGITPEEMLEKLRQPGGYDDEAFVRIPGEQPGEGERRRKIEGHLLRLFQIQNLPQKEQAILRDALLIGDSGMPRSLFWKLSPEIRKGSDKDAYQHLVALGYISESLQAPADEPLLHIHALVRVVGRKKVPPTEEEIEAFLSGVRNNRSMKADSDDSLWPSFYSMEVKLLSVAESYQMAWSFSPQNTYLSFKRAVDALDWYDHSHLAKRNREFSEKALVRGVTL